MSEVSVVPSSRRLSPRQCISQLVWPGSGATLAGLQELMSHPAVSAKQRRHGRAYRCIAICLDGGPANRAEVRVHHEDLSEFRQTAQRLGFIVTDKPMSERQQTRSRQPYHLRPW